MNTADARTLVVDGASSNQTGSDGLKNRINELLQSGGQVLYCFHSTNDAVAAINKLLPRPLGLTSRWATALCNGADGDENAGITLPDLYFAEEKQDKCILKCGLSGELVRQRRVVLKASDTDWSQFNNVPENAKCGAVELYEALAKPGGAGKIYISAIEPDADDRAHADLWQKLLRHMGIPLGKASVLKDQDDQHEHNLLLNGPKQQPAIEFGKLFDSSNAAPVDCVLHPLFSFVRGLITLQPALGLRRNCAP